MTVGGNTAQSAVHTAPAAHDHDTLAYGGLAIGDMAEMLAAGGPPSAGDAPAGQASGMAPAPRAPPAGMPNAGMVHGGMTLAANAANIVMVRPEDEGDDDSDEDPAGRLARDKRSGRRKIRIEYIDDKSRRHITFSKRKAGIMKKAYELSTLTGTQVLLLVASETGHVYTFATPKLQPLITKHEGKNLIQACLNAPDTDYAAVGAPYDAHDEAAGKEPALYDERAQAYAAGFPFPVPQTGASSGTSSTGGAYYQAIYAAAAAAAAHGAQPPAYWPQGEHPSGTSSAASRSTH